MGEVSKVRTVRQARHRRILGAHLRRLRVRAALTEAALAEKAGLSQQYVHRIEQGLVNVPVETLLQLAKGLQVPLSALVVALDHHCLVPFLPQASSLD